MQILMWILLPILLSAIMLTIFLHYRKKRKASIPPDDAENSFILAAPEQFNHKISDGQYVFFDHSRLIREYKSRMFYNHARYAALRKDYAALEARYSSLAGDENPISLVTLKKTDMKDPQEQIVDELVADAATEKKELSDKLEQLHRSYQRLEEENRFLQEQITLQTADDSEQKKIFDNWKKKHSQLLDKVAEQDYLEELLEEKKEQIIFLQTQLEQRIRNQHQAEQQRRQAMVETEESQADKQNALSQAEELKNELVLKQDHADKLQAILCGKEEQMMEMQQDLLSKQDHITCLENVLQETKQQNELLNAELADKKDEIAGLQQLLSDEKLRLEFMEQKLVAKKQLMRRLYNEFSACMEEENDKPSFVVIRPDRIEDSSEEQNDTEWDERMVH